MLQQQYCDTGVQELMTTNCVQVETGTHCFHCVHSSQPLLLQDEKNSNGEISDSHQSPLQQGGYHESVSKPGGCHGNGIVSMPDCCHGNVSLPDALNNLEVAEQSQVPAVFHGDTSQPSQPSPPLDVPHDEVFLPSSLKVQQNGDTSETYQPSPSSDDNLSEPCHMPSQDVSNGEVSTVSQSPLQNTTNGEVSATVESPEVPETDLCRYYHVFREGELVSLISHHIPGVKVMEVFYDHANWGVVLLKIFL
jgi:hypothetical protein